MTKTCKAILATAAIALSACGGTSTSGVPWGDYSPAARTRIDTLAVGNDCPALQAEFDQAEANGAATLTRTGHNNAELMGYIDTAMRDAGCY